MQVTAGDRVCPDARVVAEPIEDLLFHDYYSRTPRIRLTGNPADQDAQSAPDAAVILDGNDVAALVECAVRHPSLNMRHAVLTAIWNHPETFREIFRFGLEAPEAFAEIRKIVAEELQKRTPQPGTAATAPGETLLPRLPLPAHLRGGKGRE